MPSPTPLHLRGVVLPGEVERDVYVVDGKLTFEPVPGAETVSRSGWLVPGLVDAHLHIGMGPHGAMHDEGELRAQARRNAEGGTLLLREIGSPADTRFLDHDHDAPRIVRAGRHIARPKRYSPGMSVEVEPDDLPAEMARQAAAGDGWVKIVGDWIDRDEGDLTPLWPAEALRLGVEAAHAAGAKVAVHTFGEEALADLIAAGVDSVEHGTGLGPDNIARMAERGTVLVPTLINVDNFPAIADGAGKYPVYAARMRRLHGTARQRVRDAYEAGIPIYAGTDAGSMVRDGRIADEIMALHQAGIPAAEALAAGSWSARAWLGLPGIEEGAPADLAVFPRDPRTDLTVLRDPALLVLRGTVLGARR